MSEDTFYDYDDAVKVNRSVAPLNEEQYHGIVLSVDSRCPPNPEEYYGDEFNRRGGWRSFLGLIPQPKPKKNGVTRTYGGQTETEAEKRQRELEKKQAAQRKKEETRVRELEREAQQKAKKEAEQAARREAHQRVLVAKRAEEQRKHHVNPEVKEAKERLATIHAMYEQRAIYGRDPYSDVRLNSLEMLDMCIDPGGMLLD